MSEIDVENYCKRGSAPECPVVIESYKLMWFLNPKAASTSTRELLWKMSNPDLGAVKTQSIPYNKLYNLLTLADYPPYKARSFLSSPHWTRVITLRDAKEKILSAYLDKERRFWNDDNKQSYFSKACCNHESVKHIKDCANHKFTFTEFINLSNICSRKNAHWNAQYDIVADWDVINYVVNFKNLANGTRRLLKTRVNGEFAWKKFGAIGWGANGTSAIFEENNRQKHSTLSKRQSLYNKYYTPELEKIVEERFSKDYQLLHKYFPKYY